MIPFIPEYEAERLLEHEVRDLALPQGGTRSVRTSVHAWELFDLILQSGTYAQSEIIELTHKNRQGAIRSFDEAFTSVISYIHKAHEW